MKGKQLALFMVGMVDRCPYRMHPQFGYPTNAAAQERCGYAGVRNQVCAR